MVESMGGQRKATKKMNTDRKATATHLTEARLAGKARSATPASAGHDLGLEHQQHL